VAASFRFVRSFLDHRQSSPISKCRSMRELGVLWLRFRCINLRLPQLGT
jgi:hypothetical protein